MNERTVFEIAIDNLITEVNREIPSDGDARLRVYEQVATNLLAMVHCLRGDKA